MQRASLKYLCFLLLALPLLSSAQKDAELIHEGNNKYHSGKVAESSADYAKALELNPNNRKANFNLGNALYKNAMMIKSGNLPLPPGTKIKPDSLAGMVFDKAIENFNVVANSISDKDTLHRAWHNIGNCYLQKKDYAKAVEAYKKSLKFNPKDEETRYNLAYALKHMPRQQNKGGGGSNKPQDKKQDDKKQDQQQSQMNKEQAEQMLKTLLDSEKRLQDKRKQKPENAESQQPEKDW